MIDRRFTPINSYTQTFLPSDEQIREIFYTCLTIKTVNPGVLRSIKIYIKTIKYIFTKKTNSTLFISELRPKRPVFLFLFESSILNLAQQKAKFEPFYSLKSQKKHKYVKNKTLKTMKILPGVSILFRILLYHQALVFTAEAFSWL